MLKIIPKGIINYLVLIPPKIDIGYKKKYPLLNMGSFDSGLITLTIKPRFNFVNVLQIEDVQNLNTNFTSSLDYPKLNSYISKNFNLDFYLENLRKNFY